MEAVILRSFGFAGIMVLGGAVIFDLVVWKAPGSAVVATPDVDRRYAQAWRRMAVAAWTIGVMAWSVASIRLASERGVAIVALLTLALAGAYRLHHGRFRPPGQLERGPVRTALEVALLAALLLAVALAGHARLGSIPGLKVSVAFVHVSAAAAWVGGLASVLLAAVPAVRGLDEEAKVVVMAPRVARLSNVAVASVSALVLTGTYSAWVAVGGIDGLGTRYGVTLLAKVGAFVLVLALGAVNKQWTKPRLLALARRARVMARRRQLVGAPLRRGRGAAGQSPAGAGTDASPLRILTRLVIAEVVMVIVVLGLSALLVGLSPPTAVPLEP